MIYDVRFHKFRTINDCALYVDSVSAKYSLLSDIYDVLYDKLTPQNSYNCFYPKVVKNTIKFLAPDSD